MKWNKRYLTKTTKCFHTIIYFPIANEKKATENVHLGKIKYFSGKQR